MKANKDKKIESQGETIKKLRRQIVELRNDLEIEMDKACEFKKKLDRQADFISKTDGCYGQLRMAHHQIRSKDEEIRILRRDIDNMIESGIDEVAKRKFKELEDRIHDRESRVVDLEAENANLHAKLTYQKTLINGE